MVLDVATFSFAKIYLEGLLLVKRLRLETLWRYNENALNRERGNDHDPGL